jgi:hypothetical protein
MTTTLLDLVTGRVLFSRALAGAGGPVSALVDDHMVFAAYWNARAARPEMAVTALYEGAVNTYDLTPWSKTRAAATAWLSSAPALQMVSPYTQNPPVAISLSYVLPVVRGRRAGGGGARVCALRSPTPLPARSRRRPPPSPPPSSP